MPVYISECKECGLRYSESRPMEDFRKYPTCEACHGPTFGVILQAPKSFVKGRFDPFVSTVDGSVIHNARELEEHNKRNDVRSLADGYDEQTILSGGMAKKAPEPTKEETMKDVAEAVYEVSNGYKPIIGAQDE